MPRVEHLVGWNVNVLRGQLPNGDEMISSWTLAFQDQKTGDEVHFTFAEPVRDFIVKGLMSGIVPASKLPPS